ncbi:acyl-CoA dehydrogenase C-terminal domain-containing protein, partial [Burkholderia sp.]|uniref:acyl-CoA dehydrogenase C-terminal domain-containing protein n=1 Tax=Burkholderia sp. TaxID=36773 RepID=UPI0025C199D1
VENTKRDLDAVFAGSVPYLRLAGVVLCGWQMARAMLAAHARRADDPAFYDAKIAIAQCYAEHILVQAAGLEASVLGAKRGEGVLALTEDQF